MSDGDSINVDAVTCKHFRLIDEEGKPRAELIAGNAANPYLTFQMKDKEGRIRVEIQLDADGNPFLSIFTTRNAPAISLGLKGAEGNGIQIGRPGDGAPQLVLSVPGPEGYESLGSEPSITLYGSDGEAHVIDPDSFST